MSLMVDSFPEENRLTQDGEPTVVIQAYLQAIAILKAQDAKIQALEAENNQLTQHYQEAIKQYHALKESYDHQYSQQYQEHFALPIPCYTWQKIEQQVQLLDFNPAAARFSSQILKRSSLTLGQEPDKVFLGLPTLYHHLLNCFQSKSSASQSIQIHHQNLYLRVEYVFITPNQVLMYVLDESEQRLSEQHLRQQVRQQSAIAKLGQTSLSSLDLTKLMRQAVISVARTLEVSYSCLYAQQPNTPTCLLEAGYGWPVDLIGSVTVSSGVDSHIGYTFAQRQPVIIRDLRLEQRFKGEPLLHNYRVISGVSVIVGQVEQPWGALAVYSLEEHPFSGDEIYFLQAIANVISSAVERDRQASEMNLLHRSVDAISQGIVITDARQPNNPVIYVNRGFEEITGYKETEILGQSCNFLQGRDRQQPGLEQLREAIMRGQPYQLTLRNYRKTGEQFWNELQIFPVRDEYGYLTHFIGIQTNITEQKAAGDRLKNTEEKFRSTFDLAPIGMAITDLEGHYEQVNQAWSQIIGYSVEELLQKNFLDFTHPDDRADDISLNNALSAGETTQFQREKRYIAKDGSIIHVIKQAALVKAANGQPLHVIRQMIDISDRKKMEQQLLQGAFYDSLTGLPNRLLLQERIQQLIKTCQRYPEHHFAVLFLDLDHFKWVNDSMGHHLGDLLLQAFAERIKDCLRESDTLARLGGDEFVVLLNEIHHEAYAVQISQRIHTSLERPFELEGQLVYAEVSIGILPHPETYDSADAILRDADVAMYQAKSKGRSRSETFDQALQAQVSNRRYLEQQLREAIANNQLQMRYRPIVNLQTGDLAGFAAQVHWEHDEQGWIDPNYFLTLAEETGLILPLSRWTISTICKHLQQWQSDVPQPPLMLFLAITARQLRGGHFLDLLKTMPQQTNSVFDQLVFEFNENLLSNAAQETRQQLIQLRQLGINIFLDGFGTSNMSLNSLYHQLVHGLILEPELLGTATDLKPNPVFGDRHSILEAMVSLAHSLKLQILVQGVQTETQWQTLRQLHCLFGQGDLFGDYQSFEVASQLRQHHWHCPSTSPVL